MLRVITRLRVEGGFIKPGALLRENALPAEVRHVLLTQGRLAPVQGPPIAVVPGFEPYAAELAAHGIESIGALLDCDADTCPDLPLEDLQRQALVLVQPVCNHCGGD